MVTKLTAHQPFRRPKPPDSVVKIRSIQGKREGLGGPCLCEGRSVVQRPLHRMVKKTKFEDKAEGLGGPPRNGLHTSRSDDRNHLTVWLRIEISKAKGKGWVAHVYTNEDQSYDKHRLFKQVRKEKPWLTKKIAEFDQFERETSQTDNTSHMTVWLRTKGMRTKFMTHAYRYTHHIFTNEREEETQGRRLDEADMEPTSHTESISRCGPHGSKSDRRRHMTVWLRTAASKAQGTGYMAHLLVNSDNTYYDQEVYDENEGDPRPRAGRA